MNSKNKLFVKARLEGKSVEEAAQSSGITEQELLSARRSEAGRRGAASRKGVLINEQNRRRKGREFQAQFDQEIATVEAELDSYNYSNVRESNATSDYFGMCCSILEGIGWQRQYPEDPFAELDNPGSQEEQKFSGYPDVDAAFLIGWGKHVNLPKLLGLKKLAIAALEQFAAWTETQTKDFTVLVISIKNALPKIKLDTLYEGPPPVEPRQPIKSLEEQTAERSKWEWKGRDPSLVSIGPTKESLALQEEQRRIEGEIRQKAEEARRLAELERLRNLPMDAIRFLQEGR